MLVKHVFAFLALVTPMAAQTRVDSMSYGNNSTEWQSYATDGPVTAFVPKGQEVWYATASSVGVISLKTGGKKLIPELGSAPAEGVSVMTRDKAGTIWMGSSSGVIAGQGTNFKVYTKADGLPDGGINALCASQRGLWVGTDQGAALFSGQSWTVYTSKDGLSGNNVRSIVEDKTGTVWFATNKGIATFDGSSWKKFDTKSGLSSNDVRVLAYDGRKNMIWAAVGDQDVNSYDGTEWKVFMAIQQGITCIMTDTQSRIWFGSEKGVIKYNGFEWVLDPQQVGIPAGQVQAMYRDEKGDLWFGMDMGILHMKNPYPF
jgi:ligand-binding sensor domain-containing protein